MEFNKKIIIPSIIVLIIIVIIAILYIRDKKENKSISEQIENSNQITSSNNETEQEENLDNQNKVENTNSKEENERINKVKEKYGFTGDNSLYTENNNELSIKPDVAYRTALIGSLEQRKPTYEEINNTNVNGEPQDVGIWVSPQSRETFLNCINSVENSYEIDQKGYLKIKKAANSKYSTIFTKIEQDNSLVIVDMTGIDYIVDIVTGDIFKNEFEAMDPYQTYEYFECEQENKAIIILNSNGRNKLSNQEIIEDMMKILE